MSDRVVLAIETSQRAGGVALRDPSGVLVEDLSTETRHDDGLMPAVGRLFAQAGRRPRDLDAVGVSVGPGGFTGLRIAVSTVKMLALVTGCRVVAVPTALVVAEGTPAGAIEPGPVSVVLAVKRDAFWAARLARTDDGWRDVAPAGPSDVNALDLDGLRAVLADAHLPEALRTRCAAAGLPIVEPRFDPRACLALTERALARGDIVDALTLAPIYARAPEATRLWDLRHDDGGARVQ